MSRSLENSNQLTLFKTNRAGWKDLDREFYRVQQQGNARLERLTDERRCQDMVDETPKGFGDLTPPQLDVDEYIKVDNVFNVPIVVEDFMILDGSNGEYAAIKAHFPKGKATIGFSCGGVVIMKKLHQARDLNLLPLPGMIVKVPGKRYYDIVNPEDRTSEEEGIK